MKYAIITLDKEFIKANIIAKLEEVTNEPIIQKFRTLTEAKEYYKTHNLQAYELKKEATQ